MNQSDVRKILKDTAYVRTGGSEEELACAHYLAERCRALGLDACLEAFPVPVYREKEVFFTVNEKKIACRAIHGCAGEAEGELFYLESMNESLLRRCRDKIVLTERQMGYKLYDQLVLHGARGFICAGGSVMSKKRLLDARERRFSIEGAPVLPGVLIHTEDALRLIKRGGKVRMKVSEEECVGCSHNVIADIAGETDEMLVISAHYDSTALSVGAYDNMSGCIALLFLAEYFLLHRPRRRIRLLWCGSEERGLLGSLAYCRIHAEERADTLLNINLDMLGSAMGGFVSFSPSDGEMEELLSRFAKRHRHPTEVRHAIRSSDSNSFMLFDVPAISFARYAPADAGAVHTSFDTEAVLSPARLLSDARYIAKLTEELAKAPELSSVARISEEVKTEVERYFTRKIKQ
ncbi:MAG: Zn-dependent exopeptidase M28 [Ruminococcaceae bacterium]|nr:Zn-dependent exopeptidase M28 [Oscillospiraceae bacterium]